MICNNHYLMICNNHYLMICNNHYLMIRLVLLSKLEARTTPITGGTIHGTLGDKQKWTTITTTGTTITAMTQCSMSTTPPTGTTTENGSGFTLGTAETTTTMMMMSITQITGGTTHGTLGEPL